MPAASAIVDAEVTDVDRDVIGRRVLLVTADAVTSAAVRRAAAAVVTEVSVVAPAAAASSWCSPAPVVVDAAAVDMLPPGLPHRERLLLVTADAAAAAPWQAAVRLGAEAVLGLPQQERELLAWLAAGSEPAASGLLACFLPGRGGAGASTLASAVALAAAAEGHRTLLLDLDATGGGLDLVLGVERRPGPRWPDVVAAQADLPDLLDSLPTVADASVLSCAPREPSGCTAQVAADVITAALRSHSLVVADLARSPGDVGRTALSRASTGYVVASCDVRAASAAAGLVRDAGRTCDDVRLVVRTPGPGDLRPRDVADAVAAPLAAGWRWDRRLGAAVDAGVFATRWRHSTVGPVARRLLADLLGDVS